jgi:hypothetical protein
VGKKKQRKQALRSRIGGKKNNIAIMVGMPIHHYMDNFTAMCVDATAHRLSQKGIPFHRLSTLGLPDVAKARNQIVDEFLKAGEYTHLMWIDADMVWDAEAVEALIALDTPVASCLVTKKGPPFNVTMFQLMKPTEDSKFMDTYNVPLGAYPLDKPFTYPNSGIGTAFMLVSREVIEKMEQPYFTGFVNPVDKVLKGTDFYFCVQILKHGYDIVYEPRPRIYHVGKCLFGMEDHVAFLDQKEEKGIDVCQFMNLGASVVEFKKSFAGPQPSLIDKIAPAVEKQKELSRLQEESKSESRSCLLSAKDAQTSAETRTTTGAVKSRLPTVDINHQTPLGKEPTTNISVAEQ